MIYPRREKVKPRVPITDYEGYGHEAELENYLQWCKEAFAAHGRTVQAAVVSDVLVRLAASKLEKLLKDFKGKRQKLTRAEAKAILKSAGFTILDEDETHLKAYSDELRGIAGDMERGTLTVGCHYNNKRNAISPRGHADIEKAVGHILQKRGESSRSASSTSLFERFAGVIADAENGGMVRVAGILHSAFERLAATTCPHCGSPVGEDGEQAAYCDSCDRAL
jgi:hypothetical protein